MVCGGLCADLSSGGDGRVAEDLGANELATTRRATAIGEVRHAAIRGCKFHDSEYMYDET